MFKCCSLSFENLQSYLKHLDFHRANTLLQVKCNSCGFNSRTWAGFKRHYKSDHPKTSIGSSLSNEESENFEYDNNEPNFSNTDHLNNPISHDHEELMNEPLLEAIFNQSIQF